jgi:energy-coupling factor transporter ATP-binding protein EcfA2
VEQALRDVDLWDSVRDRLKTRATELPLEQQQKLCIARLLPMKPSVILMDEPCSALDASGTRAVEALMRRMAGGFTVVIVTHNMAQARRVSEDCVFMLSGEIVEHGRTDQIFEAPYRGAHAGLHRGPLRVGRYGRKKKWRCAGRTVTPGSPSRRTRGSLRYVCVNAASALCDRVRGQLRERTHLAVSSWLKMSICGRIRTSRRW